MVEHFLSCMVDEDSSCNILEELKKEEIPLIIYGGGSLSGSVRKILKNHGIPIEACWIDEVDIRGDINGIPIMTFDEIIRKYEHFNVVFGHSKYEMADIVVQNSQVNKCYCLVNVCYGQWHHLSYDFVKDHAGDYFATYSLLEDELSKQCLIAYLNCKLTEDFHYLLPVCREKISYFKQPFFVIGAKECIADIGAYDGDTIREFLNTYDSYEKIYAIEPEEKNFVKLQEYISLAGLKDIELYQCGCWDSDTVLKFCEDEERSSIGIDGETELEVCCLDNLLKEKIISIIKINFMSGVCETLRGAEFIIKKQKPKLIITVGFDEWGLIKIPKTIKSLNPDYKISLRFAAAMPARLILFAY